MVVLAAGFGHLISYSFLPPPHHWNEHAPSLYPCVWGGYEVPRKWRSGACGQACLWQRAFPLATLPLARGRFGRIEDLHRGSHRYWPLLCRIGWCLLAGQGSSVVSRRSEGRRWFELAKSPEDGMVKGTNGRRKQRAADGGGQPTSAEFAFDRKGNSTIRGRYSGHRGPTCGRIRQGPCLGQGHATRGSLRRKAWPTSEVPGLKQNGKERLTIVVSC